MKIDVYSHILPERYLAALRKKSPTGADFREARSRANCEINMRLRVMDRYPDVLQILTVSLPPLETLASPKDAVELARIANDELAELVAKYPDKFIGAVACLPLNDIDATLKEADRAVTELRLKGIQMFSNIDGESLDQPKFKPLYEKMAYHGLPIWIHGWFERKPHPGSVFMSDQEITLALWQLVTSGVFLDYPDIKFIAHHCGGVLPLFDGRISWQTPIVYRDGQIINTLEHLRKFYVDTACSGSTSALMCGHAFFGADHMLFGSDAPLGPPHGQTRQIIHAIEQMSIPDVDKGKIFEQNAVKLLRLAI